MRAGGGHPPALISAILAFPRFGLHAKHAAIYESSVAPFVFWLHRFDNRHCCRGNGVEQAGMPCAERITGWQAEGGQAVQVDFHAIPLEIADARWRQKWRPAA